MHSLLPRLLTVVLLAATVVFSSQAEAEEPRSQEANRADLMEAWPWEETLNNTWFGLKTWQNPMDVWVTQEILQEVKPEVVVEAGTKFGGSAVLWATLLEHITPGGRVITIDIVNKAQKARRHPVAKERVHFILGSSTAPKTVEEVERRVAGKRVLVILDSLHTREHVLEELKLYSGLVGKGSYIIVQDTWGTGAGEAVQDFLATDDGFEIDKSRHRFVLTSNFNGFLKRVR